MFNLSDFHANIENHHQNVKNNKDLDVGYAKKNPRKNRKLKNAKV